MLLIFLSIAGSSDSDNRGRRGGGFVYFPDFWLLTDDRSRARGRTRSHGRRKPQRGDEEPADVSMTFMQAVTSWVFGDGDPNTGFEDARWAAAAAYIQAHGGVVAAEEMRPFLDGADDSSAAGVRSRFFCKTPFRGHRCAVLITMPSAVLIRLLLLPESPPCLSMFIVVCQCSSMQFVCKTYLWNVQEEAYMLPLLLRLEGEAVIDDGVLLYRFPELQKRARAEADAPKWRLGGMVQRGAERVSSLVFGEPLADGVKSVAPENNFLAPVGAYRFASYARSDLQLLFLLSHAQGWYAVYASLQSIACACVDADSTW